MGVFPPFLLENTLIGSTHTMSPLTYKEFECRAGMSHWGTWKAWAASWPFVCGRSWGFGGWGGGVGGGGGAREKKKKKWVGSRGHHFFFFFSFSFSFCPPPPSPPPQPQCPVCLFLYFASLPPSPLLLPYQETPDCSCLRPPHEPPYPPLLTDLIARNLGTHRDALQRLKT